MRICSDQIKNGAMQPQPALALSKGQLPKHPCSWTSDTPLQYAWPSRFWRKSYGMNRLKNLINHI